MKNFVSIGLCTIDTYIILNRYPTEDSKLMAKQIHMGYGGSATNIVMMMSYLSIDATLVSVISNTKNGYDFINYLKKRKLFTGSISSTAEEMFKAYILINMSNATRTAIGVDGARLKELNDIQRKIIKDAKFIYIDGSVNEILTEEVISIAHSSNARVFYNLEFFTPKSLELFNKSEYGIISEQAARNIGGKRTYYECLKELWNSRSKFIGITMGRKGSLIYDGTNFLVGNVYDENTIDSSGAGDAFQCGLILGILKKWDLRFSINFASIMAALNCTEIGGHNYKFSFSKLMKAAVK